MTSLAALLPAGRDQIVTNSAKSRDQFWARRTDARGHLPGTPAPALSVTDIALSVLQLRALDESPQASASIDACPHREIPR